MAKKNKAPEAPPQEEQKEVHPHSTAIEVYQRSPLELRMQYASVVSQAGDLVPIGYRNKDGSASQGKVLVALEMGAALGMPPITALREIYVVEGRPSISALGMQALVRNAGHRVRVWVEGSGQQAKAIATVHRADDPGFEYRSEWDASRVQHLKSKTNYVNHFQQMIVARAVGEVCRQAAPEALLGIAYTTEEVQDFDVVGIDEVLAAPQSEPITEPEEELSAADKKKFEGLLLEAESSTTVDGINAVGTKAKKLGWLTRRVDDGHNFEEYLIYLVGELVKDKGAATLPNEDPADPA